MTNRPTQRASRLVRSCNNRCQILFSVHVAAYSSGRLHRAVSPVKAPQPPTGALWLHEVKHDGFRVIARKHGARVKLYSRPGNDVIWR
jgi:ATP-dependent DNA ligase